MQRRGFVRVLVAAAAAAAIPLAASCGPASQPERVLRYRMPEDPPRLDPYAGGNDNSNVYLYLLFDGLVEFVPGSTDVRPAVAESWTLSPDGLIYTFKLRPGVTFHNGREVTADDVVYSVRRALSRQAKSEKASFFAALKGQQEFWKGETADLPGVSAPDARTVVFTLAYPYGAFPAVLASEAGSILPKEVYDDPAQAYLRKPVGCGPYRFEAWDPGVSITLKRFGGHWKQPLPPAPITTISFRMIGSASTAMEEYRAGHLDFTQEIPPGQREKVMREMPDHFHNWPRMSILFLGFNQAVGPFKGNSLLRQAIGLAVDRDYIVRVLQEGKDLPAAAVIVPGMLGSDPARPPLAFDADRAARLLAEAGYPGGKGLEEITYLHGNTEGFRRLAERLQSDLSRIGVKVRSKSLDLGAFYAALTAAGPSGPEAQLFTLPWYADWPDPDSLMAQLGETDGGGNFGRYSNSAFDDLVRRARQESDKEKRAGLYREADTLLVRDAALVPIYWYGQDILLRPDVKGLRSSPLGVFGIPWEEMSLER